MAIIRLKSSLQNSGGINSWCFFIPFLPSAIISGVSYEVKTTRYNAITDAYMDIRLSLPYVRCCPLLSIKMDPAALRRPLLTAAWCFSGLGHCLSVSFWTYCSGFRGTIYPPQSWSLALLGV